jgi:hypothetical protein
MRPIAGSEAPDAARQSAHATHGPPSPSRPGPAVTNRVDRAPCGVPRGPRPRRGGTLSGVALATGVGRALRQRWCQGPRADEGEQDRTAAKPFDALAAAPLAGSTHASHS